MNTKVTSSERVKKQFSIYVNFSIGRDGEAISSQFLQLSERLIGKTSRVSLVKRGTHAYNVEFVRAKILTSFKRNYVG